MMAHKTLPYLDLHRHLDGNIRVETILSLAQQHKVVLPTYNLQALEEYIHIQDSTPDLLAFLERVNFGVSVLGDIDACERIAFENVEDAYNEGLSYVELRFSPHFMARSFSLKMSDVVAAVIRGTESACTRYPIQANLIGILSRSFGIEACMTELQSLLVHHQEITALDLAGDEIHYPAELFAEHFALAKAQTDWYFTVHAGEADGPQSVWNAIQKLGATRIGHGVRSIEDPALMEYLAEHQIGLECCLTSNYQTGTWHDLSSHPVRDFLEQGILICLNTDDPGVSKNTLKQEFTIAKEIVGLSNKQCEKLKQNAIGMAFLNHAQSLKLKNKDR